ncbi:uncharacterized protein LOC120425795 [Culex pipiens pallens]|uniref:uncharacterized protein LOC120425795 n=1 Tax=Culex pipiens pallens TaxID=42434 RepID=UPI0019536092|nr:uncharacterized protein LOC120425795 [Culex pipiens pallens]
MPYTPMTRPPTTKSGKSPLNVSQTRVAKTCGEATVTGADGGSGWECNVRGGQSTAQTHRGRALYTINPPGIDPKTSPQATQHPHSPDHFVTAGFCSTSTSQKKSSTVRHLHRELRELGEESKSTNMDKQTPKIKTESLFMSLVGLKPRVPSRGSYSAKLRSR